VKLVMPALSDLLILKCVFILNYMNLWILDGLVV